MQLNVNTNACIAFTNKLERLSKSALPVAVRGALNKAAFDVKTNTMPKKASETFKKRQPNFFKANSRVEMAKGFSINTMKSTVGFLSTNLKGSNNYAVKDLEQQEDGGTIGGKGFIPMDAARSGNNHDKSVRANARLANIKNIVYARKSHAKSQKQKSIRAAFMAVKLHGNNAFVMGNLRKGNRILYKINSISSNFKSHKLIIKRTPLYTFRKGRKVQVSSTHFMKAASLKSGNSIDKFFEAEAKRQMNKI